MSSKIKEETNPCHIQRTRGMLSDSAEGPAPRERSPYILRRCFPQDHVLVYLYSYDVGVRDFEHGVQ